MITFKEWKDEFVELMMEKLHCDKESAENYAKNIEDLYDRELSPKDALNEEIHMWNQENKVSISPFHDCDYDYFEDGKKERL